MKASLQHVCLVCLTTTVTAVFTPANLSLGLQQSEKYNSEPWTEPILQKAQNDTNVRSILILENGEITAEYTRPGVNLSEPFPVFSVTKSWSSLLVGVMEYEGYIVANETLGDIFPGDNSTFSWDDVQDAEFKKSITIESLLTMSSGLISPPRGDEIPDFGEGGTIGGANMTDSLNYPALGNEGEFSYLAQSNILSYVLKTRTGRSPREYLAEKVLQPLGISNDDFTWDRNQDGVEYSFHGMSLTMEQLAKFGQLYLQEGMANSDDRVLSQEWVQRTGSPLVDTSVYERFSPIPHYGYLFWVFPEEQDSVYCAVGFASQFVCVNPERGTVFVQQSEFANVSFGGMDMDLLFMAMGFDDSKSSTTLNATQEEATSRAVSSSAGEALKAWSLCFTFLFPTILFFLLN